MPNTSVSQLTLTANKTRGYIFVIIAGILIALMPTVGKILVSNTDSINPILLTALVFGIATAGTAPISRKILKPNLPIVSIAICGVVIGPLIFYYALIYTSAAHGVILANSETVFTVFVALTIFREKLARLGIVGVVLIIVGVFAASIVTNNINDTKNGLFGDILIVVAGIAFAFDNNISNKLIQRGLNTAALTTTKFLLGVLFLIPIILIMHVPIPSVSTMYHAIPNILYSGVLGFGLGYVLQYKALKEIGVVHTIMILTVVANALSLVFIYLILHENIPFTQVGITLSLVCVGVYLLESK